MSTTSWNLKKSAELGGRAMLAWLDPQDNYMPVSGYKPSHDVGRWWDAMLRLEQATGFSIPSPIEDAMFANLKRLTDNPDGLLVCEAKGRWQREINPHNLRETMLAYHALVRWRSNDWARQRGHTFLQALDRAFREDGHFDASRLGLWGTVPLWIHRFHAEEENSDGWFDATQTTGRCLEAVVWFYEATGDELALRLADRLARLHLRMIADDDGEARLEFFDSKHLGHNHSYMGTLRGLFLFGRLTGQRHYIDAVTRIYRHSIWQRNISRDGWTSHDLGITSAYAQNRFGDKQYESASPGDISQLALWLALHDHQADLLDDVERILRSHLLPVQITAEDVGAPARKGDMTVGENWIGGWGCQFERQIKDLIYDVLAAVVHSLSDLYAHTTVRDQHGLTLNWHFDYEDDQLRVTHVRTDEAVVCVEPKKDEPLRIRIPAWTPSDSIRVSIGGRAVQAPRIGAFLYLDCGLVKNRTPITLRYALPAYTTQEKCGNTIWRLAWRGDAVVDTVPIRPGEPRQNNL
ncbi:MAG: beta-L-arabinofuranosidase domain-containing protein [Victivallales bacterium]